MYTVASAAVIGARHARTGRNGQDAVATIVDGDVAVAVVCDGCGSGASSEVGARLGAAMFASAVARRLTRGEPLEAAFEGARAEVAVALGALLARLAEDEGGRARALHAHLLFTIVAAAMTRDGAAVWALGDGAYSVDHASCELGPFPDNAPPYLAYDLVGDPREAHVARVDGARALVVATDGAVEAGLALGELAAPALVGHPDALRRRLALLARPGERIDWAARRVVRTPATIQDDCAVAVIQRTT
ncbi:MAG: protein phosphatase 2C domain-containing protein [Proteobacteria bacterium]|nr:protein phosphatase 2C domain-containing protein [Pseudomonadota bacterium]